MKNLLEFLGKYYHWVLFVVLEVISLVMLFQFSQLCSRLFLRMDILSGVVLLTDEGKQGLGASQFLFGASSYSVTSFVWGGNGEG